MSVLVANRRTINCRKTESVLFSSLRQNMLQALLRILFQTYFGQMYTTSSYPGWIKSPHVVTLGILKILDLNSLTIFGCGGGYFGVNFGHPKSEVFHNGGWGEGGISE